MRLVLCMSLVLCVWYASGVVSRRMLTHINEVSYCMRRILTKGGREGGREENILVNILVLCSVLTY